MNWRDIGVRAVKTFAQAFVGVVVAAQLASLGDLNYQLLAAALVAGISALASFAQNALAAVVTVE